MAKKKSAHENILKKIQSLGHEEVVVASENEQGTPVYCTLIKKKQQQPLRVETLREAVEKMTPRLEACLKTAARHHASKKKTKTKKKRKRKKGAKENVSDQNPAATVVAAAAAAVVRANKNRPRTSP